MLGDKAWKELGIRLKVLGTLMLTSPRLRFEAWQAADLALLHALHSDPTVQTGYSAGPEAWTWAAIEERLRGYMAEQASYGHTKWKLSLLDGTFVGRAGWSPWEGDLEIGYAIRPAFQRRGLAREASAALIGWGSHHHPDKDLVGFALVQNLGSRRVLEAAGMTYVDDRMLAGAMNTFFQWERPMLLPVVTEGDWLEYHAIRRDVLWTARNCTGYDDRHRDEFLPDNHPMLLKHSGRSIGTVRLDDRSDGSGVVRLVAIAGDMQRLGHGRTLDRLVVRFANRLGLERLLVNAAPDAVSFYAKCGWSPSSWDPDELTVIASDCVQMHKPVDQP